MTQLLSQLLPSTVETPLKSLQFGLNTLYNIEDLCFKPICVVS